MLSKKPPKSSNLSSKNDSKKPKASTKAEVTLKRESNPKTVEAVSPLPEGTTSNFYVVCIGASAGGLDAITEFITEFPIDSGVALVFIQHLPDKGSMLADILSKRTALPVHEAAHGMLIQPNNLYVIPSARNMTTDKDGKLKLMARDSAPTPLSIDVLFNALADAKEGKAMGVVLSGTASDGTLGLKSIQAACFPQGARAQAQRYAGAHLGTRVFDGRGGIFYSDVPYGIYG